MRKKIYAAVSMTEKLHELVDFLQFEGVSEHTMLEYFFDNLTSEQCYNMMKGLAEECDIDLEDMY